MSHYIMVACDLHEETMLLKVAHQREKPLMRKLRNKAADRAGMISWLKQLAQEHGDAEVVFAYEASCLGFGLYDELTAQGITCHVLAPTRMEKSPKHRRNKTDEKDTDKILEVLRGHLLAGNPLPGVWVPNPQTRDDREVVRMRLAVAEQLTRVKTQIQTLLKRNSLERPDWMNAWTRRHRDWLASLASGQVPDLGSGARAALRSLLRELELLEREVDVLELEVQELAGSARYGAAAQKLMQYPGVGLLTAMVFLTELGELTRFQNRRELAAYLGLVPCADESGKAEDRKGHITRQGPGRVRKVLCQAVWAGLRAHGPEARWFRQYVARHPKRKKIATVAAMRRLSIRLWHQAQRVGARAEPGASVPDSAGGPCQRAGAFIATPCTPG